MSVECGRPSYVARFFRVCVIPFFESEIMLSEELQEATPFPLGYDEQDILLAALLKDQKLLDRVSGIMRPECFKEKHRQHFCKAGFAYYEKYGTIPPMAYLQNAAESFPGDVEFAKTVLKTI